MNRQKVTFEESCKRPCTLRIGSCGGPTVHGLNGYACENCIRRAIDKLNENHETSMQSCSYCGKAPSYQHQQINTCKECFEKALKSIEQWYKTQDQSSA